MNDPKICIQCHHCPFELEMEAVGSADPDDLMGRPEGLEGVYVWTGHMVYTRDGLPG